MFSSRLPPHTEVNALTRAVDRLRASGEPFIDLTQSNPTTVGLPYPADLLRPLSAPDALTYAPDPRGLRAAREAVAADAARRGARVDPDHVVLSASTSEAYAWLFKLLCDPGDCVLVPRPSYPLFEHLTRLEAVEAIPYQLDQHGAWAIDFATIEAAPPRTRAVLVVSPNNPTGSYVSEGDAVRLARICRARGWALVADEVFADYPLDEPAPFTDLAVRLDALTFTLGGASKTLGLPQIKLGWMVVGGRNDERTAALAALDVIADTFLSVGTPVQAAAGDLLAAGAVVRGAIAERTRANLDEARRAAAEWPSCRLLACGGGWSAVLRVPARGSEEQMVLELLESERVLVHPGYFFDFPCEAFVVVSLLPPEPLFAEGLRRVLRRLA